MSVADRLRGEVSDRLAGRRVVLGVTGSISAVKAVELARELIRHGADVVPVMSASAQRIISADALEFATGHAPVTKLTGAVEHVRDLGRGPGKADLFLVAPCTGNTLAKMALGVDDTAVTTYFTVGARTTPTIVAPAMHDSMYESPFLQARMRELRDAGVTVLEPHLDEGKAKLPDVDLIVEHVLRALGPRTLEGRRLLVVNGSTIEPLDDMRVITNKSTGRTGNAIAVEAWRLGADVTLWFGHGHTATPHHLSIDRFVTVEDLLAKAPEVAGYDAVLLPAAISDFGPAPTSGKVTSEKGVTVELAPLPKVVKAFAGHVTGLLVPFKAESGVTETRLVERARESVKKYGAPFVVANDLASVGVDATEVLLVDAERVERVKGTKDGIAAAILARLATDLDAREGDA